MTKWDNPNDEIELTISHRIRTYRRQRIESKVEAGNYYGSDNRHRPYMTRLIVNGVETHTYRAKSLREAFADQRRLMRVARKMAREMARSGFRAPR